MIQWPHRKNWVLSKIDKTATLQESTSLELAVYQYHERDKHMKIEFIMVEN